MSVMTAKRNRWTPARIKKLRDRLSLSNAEMAERLRIDIRLLKSWLYDESRPTGAGAALFSLLNDGKIIR